MLRLVAKDTPRFPFCVSVPVCVSATFAENMNVDLVASSLPAVNPARVRRIALEWILNIEMRRLDTQTRLDEVIGLLNSASIQNEHVSAEVKPLLTMTMKMAMMMIIFARLQWPGRTPQVFGQASAVLSFVILISKIRNGVRCLDRDTNE